MSQFQEKLNIFVQIFVLNIFGKQTNIMKFMVVPADEQSGGEKMDEFRIQILTSSAS